MLRGGIAGVEDICMFSFFVFVSVFLRNYQIVFWYGYLIVILICISLMVNDAEHLSCAYLILYILSSEMSLFMFCCPFSSWIVCFLTTEF